MTIVYDIVTNRAFIFIEYQFIRIMLHLACIRFHIPAVCEQNAAVHDMLHDKSKSFPITGATSGIGNLRFQNANDITTMPIDWTILS